MRPSNPQIVYSYSDWPESSHIDFLMKLMSVKSCTAISARPGTSPELGITELYGEELVAPVLMRAAERTECERAASVFRHAILQQIKGGVDRLRGIEVAAAIGVMPMDQLPPSLSEGFRRHPSDIDPEAPEQQDRVDDVDLRENFCRPHPLRRSR